MEGARNSKSRVYPKTLPHAMRGGSGDWLHQPNGSWRRATHPFASISTTASSQHPSLECWLFSFCGSRMPSGPDADGQVADVVLGFDDVGGYAGEGNQ